MIRNEIYKRLPQNKCFEIEVTIFVENGEEIAKKTLNPRLGIIGGISIIGTTGIVRPLSAKSYKETIKICLQSAKKMGYTTCVFSTGRKSEKHIQAVLTELPEQCFIQIADFFSFALNEAAHQSFKQIILSCYFGKLCKWAMGFSYTHAHTKSLDFNFLTYSTIGS